MNQRFEQIYAKNEWGHGSGEGSLPEHNRGYVQFLEEFLVRNAVQSVVEMGCGDWQFSKDIRWGAAEYHGFDVVPAVVEYNQKHYGGEKVNFTLYSGDPAELPGADLLIVKDVLQHLNDQAVHRALAHFPRFKRVLATNCVNPWGPTVHRDIEDGDFRYLDLRLPPFGLQATEVYSFHPRGSLKERLLNRPRWRKKVLLVESRPAS
jgi:2-polyprenyl-3-methyl-5-hydroxy-6-metoxy-1,4-benzoquinol methylase